MSIELSRPSNILVLLSLAMAISGGVFFGLFSCGGYVWHIQAYWAAALLFITLSITVKNQLLNSIFAKLSFPVVFIILFWVVQSVAATFYPAAPESIAEFIRSLLLTLEYGPCF